MAIQYLDSASGVSPAQLSGFFEGWPDPPTAETHLRILEGSSHVALALVSDQVVGFATAMSDHVLTAYISLLEVLPAHRHGGIGRELVRRLLGQLRGMYSINLHCDLGLQPFYEALGMQPLGGMAIRDFSAQSGSHAA